MRVRGTASTAPLPLSTSPSMGPSSGGTSVTVTGMNFKAGCTATLGGASVGGVGFLSSTQITITTPAGSPGAATLAVTNPDGQSGTLANAFTYASFPVPTLTGVSTSGGAVGDIAGGYPATLTGTGFAGTTGVTFGGTLATSVVVVSSTSITCVVPAHATGSVSVVVTTPGGSNGANTLFRYFSPAELALSEWQRGSYSVAPWAANASAGASSGRTATTTGNDPSAGTGLNGFAPAHFTRASTQSLNASVANNTLFSTVGTFVCLARSATQQAPSGVPYGDGNLCGDPANAETTFGITSAGFNACVQDSGGYKRPATAAALANSTWGACEGVFDGTNLSVRVNGGTAQSVACGNYAPATPSVPRLGYGYLIAYFDGDIQEWMTSAVALTLANRNDIRSYFNTRYFPAGAQV